MGDLIRRDDVIKTIHGYWYNKMKKLPSKPIGDDEEVIIDTRKANEYLEHNKQLSLFVELIKTVEVAEPKHGRWITDGHYERCSECGEPTNEYHNYCPNCGAKMEVDE